MPLNEQQINDELELIAAALFYIRNGFPMFPCKPRRKEPLCQHGFKDATTDEETVKAWWTKWPQANLGMPTGSASGLLFLDCDPRNGDQPVGANSSSALGRCPRPPKLSRGRRSALRIPGSGRTRAEGASPWSRPERGGWVRCTAAVDSPER